MNRRATVDLYGVMASALAGLVAGALVAGPAARLAMRVVAILSALPPEFSLAGTVAIMVVTGMLGLVAGLVYGVVRPVVPLPGLGKGLAFGIFLAVLISLPFLRAPEGELALAEPAVGVMLFGGIGLLYGLALEAVLRQWDDRRTPRRTTPVHLVWLGLGAFFSGLALVSMATLMGEFVRFPPAASTVYLAGGLDFQRAHELHGLLMLAYAIAYIALVFVVLWKSADRWVGSLAGLSLALLAAGWFSAAPYPTPEMTGLAAVALLPGLVKAAGPALLVLVMFLWPDGRFWPVWTRVAFAAWCLWLALWLLTPAGQSLPSPMALAMTAAGLFTGWVALALRRRDDPDRRSQITPLLVGYGMTIVWFLSLWAVALRQPALQIFRATLPETLFAFAPYLLPWLLLPVSLVAATLSWRDVPSQAVGAIGEQLRAPATDASVTR